MDGLIKLQIIPFSFKPIVTLEHPSALLHRRMSKINDTMLVTEASSSEGHNDQFPITSCPSLDTISTSSSTASIDTIATSRSWASNDSTSLATRESLTQRTPHPSISSSSSSSSSFLSTTPHSKKLFEAQFKLLLRSTCVSLLLFLYFVLNTFAYVALLIFTFSTLVLFQTALSYTQYQIENVRFEDFISYLPESTKEYVLETTLHDVLMDLTGYIYSR